jgi:hypothetical protein
MKKIAFSILSFLCILCMPIISVAHPGHGETDGHTIIHYILEPIHAIAAFSGVLLLALGYFAFMRTKKQDIKVK